MLSTLALRQFTNRLSCESFHSSTQVRLQTLPRQLLQLHTNKLPHVKSERVTLTTPTTASHNTYLANCPVSSSDNATIIVLHQLGQVWQRRRQQRQPLGAECREQGHNRTQGRQTHTRRATTRQQQRLWRLLPQAQRPTVSTTAAVLPTQHAWPPLLPGDAAASSTLRRS